MINYIMFVTTHIFCGQLDNLELTVASLGTNIGVQAYAYGLLVWAMFAYGLIT
jgi:multidrug resistance protein, MATE family